MFYINHILDTCNKKLKKHYMSQKRQTHILQYWSQSTDDSTTNQKITQKDCITISNTQSDIINHFNGYFPGLPGGPQSSQKTSGYCWSCIFFTGQMPSTYGIRKWKPEEDLVGWCQAAHEKSSLDRTHKLETEFENKSQWPPVNPSLLGKPPF